MATNGPLTARTSGLFLRGVVVGLLLPPVYLLVVVFPHHGWIDFSQSFTGAQALWGGDNPYFWQYHNPPWLAFALGPLMSLPYDPDAGQYAAAEFWFWINLTAFAGALALWLQAVGLRVRSLDVAILFLGALIFIPTVDNLFHGQTTILLLLALAVLGSPAGARAFPAGLALAVLTLVLAAALGLWYARQAWSGPRPNGDPNLIVWGVVVGLLPAPYSHGYDYVLLLLPGLLVLARLAVMLGRVRWWLAAALALAYVIPVGPFIEATPKAATLASALIAGVALYLIQPAAPAMTPPTRSGDAAAAARRWAHAPGPLVTIVR